MAGINRVAFSLFGFPVYWYGALIATGMLLGVWVASARESRYGLKRDTVLNFVLIAIPVALVCARLYYVAFSWEDYAGDLRRIFDVRSGGMAIYGGVIGGAATGLVYARRNKVSFGVLADLCVPALALGQAIGRWGNFFNQEAFGPEVFSPALQFFPLSVYIEAIGQWHYATFFYESAWCFLICATLLIAERKGAFRRRGDLFLWYLALYAAERMAVEGLRTDSLYWGDIRISQLLSACLLILTAVLFAIRAFGTGKRPAALVSIMGIAALCVPLTLAFLPFWGWVFHALLLLAGCAGLYRYTTDNSTT